MAQSNDNLSIFDFNIANVSISHKASNYLNRENLLGALSRISLKSDDYKEVYPLSSNFEIKSGHIIIAELQFMDGFVNEAMKNSVSFDTENKSMFYCQSEGFSYLRMELGGDWEMPVITFAYWSERNNRIKGFFPCGEGNVYNIVTNSAYTQEDYISPNYDLAEQIGLRQLKQIIAKDYTEFEKKNLKSLNKIK